MFNSSFHQMSPLGDDQPPRDIGYALPVAAEPDVREDEKGRLVWTDVGRATIRSLAAGYRVVDGEDPTDYTWARPLAKAHLELGEGKTLEQWVTEQTSEGRTVLLGRGFPHQPDVKPEIGMSFRVLVLLFAFDSADAEVIGSESRGVAGVPYPVFAEPGLTDRLLAGDGRSVFWVLLFAAGVGFGLARLFR